MVFLVKFITSRLLLTVGAMAATLMVTFNVYAETELPAGNMRAGAQIYNAVCKGCHEVSIAPTLRGVLNRPIASVESFTGYSEGLKSKSDLTWTKENLSLFLIDPGKFAPGTQMVQMIPELQKRADLIAFLEALPPPRN